jgi:hypothetical protein
MKSILAAVAVLSLFGCGVAQVEDGSDEASASEADLSIAQRLMGAYKASSGSLKGLVLTKDSAGKRIFFSEQVVYCFRAPCPALHLEGTWYATSKKLYLTETAPTASKLKYEWALAGDKLTLKDPDTHALEGELTKVPTWCARTDDCRNQGYMHPMCMGDALCTAEQTCGWFCGPMDTAIGYGDACGTGIKAPCASGLACTVTSGDGTGLCQPL